MNKTNLYNFDAKKIKNDCVCFIKNWFELNGKDCNAVIGISGGTDSSVVAALCVEALGKDRVFGVKMPCGEQSDISDANYLIDYLGIKSCEINIERSVSDLQHQILNSLDHITEQTMINLKPRIRMSTLYGVSQSLNGRVSNNCNLSEDWVGYSTRFGDSVGDFSPLSNLTKTEVKLIGYELGLPKELIEKVPSDGLCGKTDEDNLGFTYDELDRYIREGVIENIEHQKRIEELHYKNLFKLQPMPYFEVSYDSLHKK